MRGIQKTRIFLAGVLGLLLPCAVLRAEDKPAHLAIIVAKDSPVHAMTMADLIKVFRSEKARTDDDTRFVILMREPGSAERGVVLGGIYGMSESEYKKYFLEATFTGTVPSAPKQFNSAAAVRRYVAKTPGAIGYVLSTDVDDSVKSITVDGKSPVDADYALKKVK